MRVSFVGGSIKFVDGVATVNEAQARHLLNLPASFGVQVEDLVPEEKPAEGNSETENNAEGTEPSGDGKHDGDDSNPAEPKGNASVDEWRAYAVQKGLEADAVAELKREEIKALLES